MQYPQDILQSLYFLHLGKEPTIRLIPISSMPVYSAEFPHIRPKGN